VSALDAHDPGFADRYIAYLQQVLAAVKKDGPSAKLPASPEVRQ
jgi:hypothetical protein